jgi:hypothetical protein
MKNSIGNKEQRCCPDISFQNYESILETCYKLDIIYKAQNNKKKVS